MTWGEIRAAVQREFPTLQFDALNDAISQAYDGILAARDWQGLKTTYTLQTIAAYRTGSVSVTNGSTAITGTSTAWTTGPGLERREIQIGGRPETYWFTYVSATSGLLDRPYEGPTQTGAAYQLIKREYELPGDVRVVREAFNPAYSQDPMPQKSRSDLLAYPITLGLPIFWAPGLDSGTDADYQRILLHFAPDAVYSILVDYTRVVTGFGGRNTDDRPLSFVIPWAIVDGAKSILYPPGSAQSDKCAIRAESSLMAMHNEENKRVPPTKIIPARRYTAVDRMRRQW